MIDRFERFSFAISEISKYWHKLTSDEMEKYGLRGTHCVYLLTLAKHPQGLTAAKICELCGRDKADVSRMMAIMEEKQLVRKDSTGPKNYRALFTLTDKGHEAVAFVQRKAGRAVEIAGRDLTEENRAIFYDALDSITENLRQLSKDGIPEI